MTGLVRSASLTHYAELARASGLDVSELLQEVGLPADSLNEPDLKIPADAVRQLLELSAQRSGDESFGLRMAEARRPSNLGALALAWREEPTLRRALEALVRFGRLHNEAMFLKVEEAGPVVVLREELIVGRGAPVRQATELVIGVLYRLLRVFLGPDWTPRRVCFAHAAPRDRSVHQRVFGARIVEFGHDFNGIVCSSADLDAPNPGADPVMARYAREQLEAGLRRGTGGVVEEVRQLVFLLLPSGHCNADLVAQHLGVDRRTVHRQLAREGETFSAIVDAARTELAARYLEDRQRSLANVSALLGFATPGSFSRWHAQRFGASPSTSRKDASTGAALSSRA